MQDKYGNRLDLGMIVNVINQPDLFDSNGWIVYEFVDVGIFTHIFLKHCITHEIRIFDGKDIERS